MSTCYAVLGMWLHARHSRSRENRKLRICFEKRRVEIDAGFISGQQSIAIPCGSYTNKGMVVGIYKRGFFPAPSYCFVPPASGLFTSAYSVMPGCRGGEGNTT